MVEAGVQGKGLDTYLHRGPTCLLSALDNMLFSNLFQALKNLRIRVKAPTWLSWKKHLNSTNNICLICFFFLFFLLKLIAYKQRAVKIKTQSLEIFIFSFLFVLFLQVVCFQKLSFERK